MNINSGPINELHCSEISLRERGGNQKTVFDCDLIEYNPDIENVTESSRSVINIEQVDISQEVKNRSENRITENRVDIESDQKLYADVGSKKIEVRKEK